MSWNSINCSDECDYNYLKRRIVDVLRKHLPTDEDGNPNPEFDDCFTAEEAIDEIYGIVGGFIASDKVFKALGEDDDEEEVEVDD